MMGTKQTVNVARNSLFVFVVLLTAALLLVTGPLSAQSNNFFPQVTHSVGSEPIGLAAGDFSGDGILDIVVANRADGDITALYGQPLGGLGGRRDFPAGNYPGAIAASDFSNDGRLDVAVANGGDLGSSIRVLYGDPSGGFGASQTYAVGSGPNAIVAVDLNGDNLEDVAVANFYHNDPTGTVSVLLGNADGTFGSRQDYSVGGRYPDSLVAADFTGDNIPDLAVTRVADAGPGGVVLLAGHGDGSFAAPQQFAAGDHPRGIAMGDFNHDNLPDVATANHYSHDVTVLYGQADGEFGGPESYSIGKYPYDLTAGDFNQDGLTDLAATSLTDRAVYLLYGQSDGTFSVNGAYAVGGWCWSIVAADFDGNGAIDLAVSNAMDDTVSVLYNTLPEPATLSLLAIGGLALIRRRKE